MAIRKAGGESVILLPGEEEKLKDLGGLLLSGGGDVNPRFYGEENKGSVDIDDERDEWELGLVKNFFQQGKAILAICRGVQVLNVALGGTLCQHIEGHKGNNGKLEHKIRVKRGSFLFDILGGCEEIMVNSSHHQSVKDVAPPLEECARSDDNVIEAVEGEGFVLGVQFHPERIYENNPPIFNIFKRFIQASKREIYTLGTSKRNWREFLEILTTFKIETVVDVRRFPSSQFEWFKKGRLNELLAEAGICYIWMGEELGGYRSPNYEAYTQTVEFAQGLQRLQYIALRKKAVILCAEALFWRCHRRFIAQALKQKDWQVIHIIDRNKLISEVYNSPKGQRHPPTAEASDACQGEDENKQPPLL